MSFFYQSVLDAPDPVSPCCIVYVQHGGINNMERPRGVNLIYSAGGDPLCTLHRAEALYG